VATHKNQLVGVRYCAM